MAKGNKTIDSYLQPVLDLWGAGKEQSLCPIKGNCMAPLIQDGDLLIIRHGNSDIHTGDVAVYGEPGDFYVHRVIKVHEHNGGRTYVMKPDNHFTIMQNIQADKIIGKVVEVRGARGHLFFDSWFWRRVNSLLGFIFYSCWRSERRDTLYWRSVHNLLLLWRKLKPERYFSGRALLEFFSQVHTIFSSVGPRKSNEK